MRFLGVFYPECYNRRFLGVVERAGLTVTYIKEFLWGKLHKGIFVVYCCCFYLRVYAQLLIKIRVLQKIKTSTR